MTQLLGCCDSTPGDVSGDTGTFSESLQKNSALKSNSFFRRYLKRKSSQPNRIALIKRSLQYQLRKSRAVALRNEPRAPGSSTFHLGFFFFSHLHRFSLFDSFDVDYKDIPPPSGVTAPVNGISLILSAMRFFAHELRKWNNSLY